MMTSFHSKGTKHNTDILVRLQNNTYYNIETGCWEFKGTLSHNGYPSIWFHGKMIRVNRLSAHLHLGLDLNNRETLALHKDEVCKSRRCWNPEHIKIGSQKENVRDSVKRGTNSWKKWHNDRNS